MARLAIAFSGKYWYRKSGSPQAYEGRKNLLAYLTWQVTIDKNLKKPPSTRVRWVA